MHFRADLVIPVLGLNGYIDDRVWMTYDALGREVLEHEEIHPQGGGPGGPVQPDLRGDHHVELPTVAVTRR